MSEAEQAMVIERMAKLEEKGQTYLLGVMAGLVAMQERKEGSRQQAAGNSQEESA